MWMLHRELLVWIAFYVQLSISLNLTCKWGFWIFSFRKPCMLHPHLYKLFMVCINDAADAANFLFPSLTENGEAACISSWCLITRYSSHFNKETSLFWFSHHFSYSLRSCYYIWNFLLNYSFHTFYFSS